MWIRSQDRYALLNVNQVVIKNTKDESEYYIHGYSERGIDILGVYSIQEKALNVLDYIEDSLEYPHNTVFQMPQDDEVEV